MGVGSQCHAPAVIPQERSGIHCVGDLLGQRFLRSVRRVDFYILYIKFHENPSIGSLAVSCGQVD
jgi:hypothetical protein